MVTGQAFVLFSRLHLVVRNRKTLRLVLFMIIFNAFALHTYYHLLSEFCNQKRIFAIALYNPSPFSTLVGGFH